MACVFDVLLLIYLYLVVAGVILPWPNIFLNSSIYGFYILLTFWGCSFIFYLNLFSFNCESFFLLTPSAFLRLDLELFWEIERTETLDLLRLYWEYKLFWEFRRLYNILFCFDISLIAISLLLDWDWRWLAFRRCKSSSLILSLGCAKLVLLLVVILKVALVVGTYLFLEKEWCLADLKAEDM